MKLVHNNKAVPFYLEKEAYEGVKKIAEKVREDFRIVTGIMPEQMEYREGEALQGVFVATLGHSPLLKTLEKEGLLVTSDLAGRYEVYRMAIVERDGKELLVIAGSDKRGTIYGLFALSKAIGVSPWHYWADVVPAHRDEIEISPSRLVTSKEPSVKYRGFFINDEFPSFGNWTIEKFGGFTAEMYDKVFELLLRLNGNYLWPAMWVSSFPLDGPGLLNAKLADLYGVVIGNSHHEPCLRASEEWDKVKGPDSVYGQDWNYYTNREGLLRYWEDGLKRSGKYEGIITVGMRGERDSSMLGEDATLAQNIDLLKAIITEQKKLIRKYVNEDLSQVPMMLALYKEVEAYYYGDETTPGLKDWDGLSDIMLMLCEDNYGNMRTLPDLSMRGHKAGFGMYYHFDYHGGPISYEWVNSTPIAKVWEQMSEAYEYGVRNIWIVNVGDLKPQEFPLTFFMDLAYDFERFGTNAPNETKGYTRNFVKSVFGNAFDKPSGEALEVYALQEEGALDMAAEVLEEYTRINGMRRPEALHKEVYHPVHFDENERMCRRAEALIAKCDALRACCKEEMLPAFIELLYYPAVASANLLLMQNEAGLNAFYGEAGMRFANNYAEFVKQRIEKDASLIEEYHSLLNGKWNHMMSSNHVGFVNWNDEGWSFPQCECVEETGVKRPAVRMQGEDVITVLESGEQAKAPIVRKYRIPCGMGSCYIELLATTAEKMTYTLKASGDVTADVTAGSYTMQTRIAVSYQAGLPGNAGEIALEFGGGERIQLVFERVAPKLVGHVTDQITGIGTYLVLEAGDYIEKTEAVGAAYQLLTSYGRVKDTVKVFPVTKSFTPQEACAHQAPELIYEVKASQEGSYSCKLYISPSNPLYPGDAQRIAIGTEGKMQVITTLPEGFDAGNCHNPQWNKNVLDNIRECQVSLSLVKGKNRIHVAAVDAGVMLQRMVLCAPGEGVPQSYLGPNA